MNKTTAVIAAAKDKHTWAATKPRRPDLLIDSGCIFAASFRVAVNMAVYPEHKGELCVMIVTPVVALHVNLFRETVQNYSRCRAVILVRTKATEPLRLAAQFTFQL